MMFLSFLWETSSEEEIDLGTSWPRELPLLPLESAGPFPHTKMSLSVDQPRGVRLVREALDGDRVLALAAMMDPEASDAGPEGIYPVGAVAHIAHVLRAEDDAYLLVVRPLERISVVEWVAEAPYLKARVELLEPSSRSSSEVEALRRELVSAAGRMENFLPDAAIGLADELEESADPSEVLYALASSIRADVAQSQEILTSRDLATQMRLLLGIIDRELTVLELDRTVRDEALSAMETAHREQYVRHQLKAIQRELGEEEGGSEADAYWSEIEQAHLPEEARTVAEREIARLERLQPQSAEAGVIRTYLDWMTGLPWQNLSEGNLDLQRASDVLDEDHCGLEQIKARILEFLAVRKLRIDRCVQDMEEQSATILCFVGPPGVGKTSLRRSTARALGREFTRMSLGGLGDEAEVRGHRRTYVGAMPGRVIQALRRVGTRDPLFMLDEIDKVGADWRGDPTSALLEVLDPVQNSTFRDHYLNVDFDLSQVFFICTANTAGTVPPALLDRMEVIEIEGHADFDKICIARAHLAPRQMAANGLRPDEVAFTDNGLRTIIREYTREAGVRNLEREIARALRKVAAQVAANGRGPSVVISDSQVREFLGKPRFRDDGHLHTGLPGVATGLAWTPPGGDVLSVEARAMPDTGYLILTGQLGLEMRESAHIAFSHVQGEAERLGLPRNALRDQTVHFHVPAGSVPKDGPSAGVALVTALVSALADLPVRDGVAMTGEMTLRGQVLPVGGIKQKVLAAHRHGVRTVILPRANKAGLDEIPQSIREELSCILVDHVDEALDASLPAPVEFEMVPVLHASSPSPRVAQG